MHSMEFTLPVARTVRNGRVLVLRSVAPTDVQQSMALLRRLSYGTRYFRFGRDNVPLSAEQVARQCNPDPADGWTLVVVTDEVGVETQVASASCHLQPGLECGELTILVADAWQGFGLADWLMVSMIDVARRRALKQVFVRILATNTRMLRLARKHAFTANETAPGSIRTLSRALDESVRALAID